MGQMPSLSPRQWCQNTENNQEVLTFELVAWPHFFSFCTGLTEGPCSHCSQYCRTRKTQLRIRDSLALLSSLLTLSLDVRLGFSVLVELFS